MDNLSTFSANCLSDLDRFSKSCSSISHMPDAAKILLEEKNKQLSDKDSTILELKDKINKLKEKLEERCKLEIELSNIKVRLEEKDNQLVDIKE